MTQLSATSGCLLKGRFASKTSSRMRTLINDGSVLRIGNRKAPSPVDKQDFGGEWSFLNAPVNSGVRDNKSAKPVSGSLCEHVLFQQSRRRPVPQRLPFRPFLVVLRRQMSAAMRLLAGRPQAEYRGRVNQLARVGRHLAEPLTG